MNSPEPVYPGRPHAAGGATEARAPDAPACGAQHAAIALAYGRDDAAPRVLAKGRGLLAQAIIERAHQHGVYVRIPAVFCNLKRVPRATLRAEVDHAQDAHLRQARAQP